MLSGCQGELQWIAGAVCALPSSPGLQMNKPSCFLGWVKVTDMAPATAFPALGQGKNGWQRASCFLFASGRAQFEMAPLLCLWKGSCPLLLINPPGKSPVILRRAQPSRDYTVVKNSSVYCLLEEKMKMVKLLMNYS